MEKGKSWYTIECECPKCGNVQEHQSVEIQQCEQCPTEFEIDEPSL